DPFHRAHRHRCERHRRAGALVCGDAGHACGGGWRTQGHLVRRAAGRGGAGGDRAGERVAARRAHARRRRAPSPGVHGDRFRCRVQRAQGEGSALRGEHVRHAWIVHRAPLGVLPGRRGQHPAAGPAPAAAGKL
ncbi:MAG: hypothetical protein AVDCRST_MAG77-3120, partial [uncultured Chloroflexi bacterium]